MTIVCNNMFARRWPFSYRRYIGPSKYDRL